MANRFIGALQIKSEEQKQIWLMLATGFFMGVFIATYQVTADSLFLNRLGDQLNKAFLIAGVFGIISTAAFSFFQNWIKFTTLALGSVLFIFSFTLAAYLLLHYGDPEWHNTYIFALYCTSGPNSTGSFFARVNDDEIAISRMETIKILTQHSKR